MKIELCKNYWSALYLFFLLLFSCGITFSSSKELNGSYDDKRPHHWPEPFKRIEITSAMDSAQQAAWFYSTTALKQMPLLISLHSWSGDYQQEDPLAKMALNENWNYIHPDFRGHNGTIKACCSPYALNDIDQAIDFAIQNGHVDSSRIYVVGSSGGGYAALAVYMKSRHPINTISSWVPISDLVAWYNDLTTQGGSHYASDIIKCTGSENNILNLTEARNRSPIYWDAPHRGTILDIYTGINDGIVSGSVPITQSIYFYNKIVKDLGATDPKDLVHDEAINYLLKHRMPFGDYGKLGVRKVCLKKKYKNISLVVFDGNHEMLESVAFSSFLEE